MTIFEDISARLDRLEKAAALSKNVLSVKECAMLIGYTEKYLRLMIAQHEIPHYRRGNRIYFNRAEVESWMLGQRVSSNEEIKSKANRRK